MKITETRLNKVTNQNEVFEMNLELQDDLLIDVDQKACRIFFRTEEEAQKALSHRADQYIVGVEREAIARANEERFNQSEVSKFFADDDIYKNVVQSMIVDYGFDLSGFDGLIEKEVKKLIRPVMTDAKVEVRSEYPEDYRDEDDKNDFYVTFTDDIALYVARNLDI